MFGAKNGWERANYFLAPTPAAARGRPHPHTLGTPRLAADVLDEQRATREAVALFDQTSFGKFLLQGRDALAVLQRLCANEIDVARGRMVYTAMLNERGGFESDLTITRARRRQLPHRHRLGADDARLRLDRRGTSAPTSAARSSTSARLTAVLSVMGPNAQALLCRVGALDTATTCRRSGCRSRRRARSTSASRACARRA